MYIQYEVADLIDLIDKKIIRIEEKRDSKEFRDGVMDSLKHYDYDERFKRFKELFAVLSKQYENEQKSLILKKDILLNHKIKSIYLTIEELQEFS